MASIPSNNSKDVKSISQTPEAAASSAKTFLAAEKWKYGIDLTTASSNDLTSFVEYRTQVYECKGWTDMSLSTIFAEDFEKFKRKDFDLCTSDARAELRERLRKQGVYVPIGRGYPVSKELADLVLAEKPWPEDDPQRPSRVKSEPPQDRIQEIKAEETTQKSSSNQNKFEKYCKLAKSSIEPLNNPVESNIYHTPNPSLTPLYADTQIESALNQLELDYDHGFGRELSNLQKCYWLESQKYSGTMEESFNYKFLIFINNCKRSGIPPKTIPQAFPIMLHGSALDYYYHNCDGRDMTVNDLHKHFIKRYENEEHRRNMERKWNSISLRQMVKSNPDMPMEETFRKLVERLQQLQRVLDIDLRSESVLRQKLILACEDVEACSSACSRPPIQFTELVEAIHSAIASHEKARRAQEIDPIPTTSSTQLTNINFVDRKYHSHNKGFKRPLQQSISKLGQSSTVNDNYQQNNKGNYKGKCFICRRPNCWSTNHTEEERRKSRERITKKVEAYIQDYEGQQNSNYEAESEDEIPEQFLIDLDSFDVEDISENFIISTGSIPAYEARQFQQNLCNNVTYHLLSGNDLTESHNDPFTYIANSGGRYTSDKWHGIMLDPGSSSFSTAGCGQVKAYISTFNCGKVDKSTAGAITAQFGIGRTTSIGSINILTPIGNVTFHVVNADTPFLLCLQDMDSLKIYYNNLRDVIQMQNGKSIPVIRKFNHAFLVWGIPSLNYLTDSELRQLHRRFGHPSVNRLVKTLERAGHHDLNHRKILER
ncbi:hypothetical protein EPUL_006743, partial [Erysiphe pulchra]